MDWEEITLVYDKETRTLSAGVARSEADQSEAEKAILDFLLMQSEPLEENVIHENVEAKRAVKLKAIRKLVSDGKVTRTGTGKKGDKYRYQNAGTQVPNIYGVPEYQNPKNELSDSDESPNAGTRLFADSEQVSETRVPAFSTTEKQDDSTEEETI